MQTPEDVLRAELLTARRSVPEGARWVVSAHAFVTGGLTTQAHEAYLFDAVGINGHALALSSPWVGGRQGVKKSV
ncbi:MAG: hypothetical protein OIF54_08390 [Cohaesibacter sp.]|nr:hypothetical protein [Cohaesibacter sp.]